MITILFADIVGAVALAERFAPDEVLALVGGCVTLMSLAAEEYGGTVQAYEGDAICVYFSVPAARENDPGRLRARRSAFSSSSATMHATYGGRVGSPASPSGSASTPAEQRSAWSAAPTARRSPSVRSGRSLHECGRQPSRTILVGETTARRLAHRFEFEPLGEIEVRGREAPVAVSRLLAPSTRAPASAGTTSIGREHETTVSARRRRRRRLGPGQDRRRLRCRRDRQAALVGELGHRRGAGDVAGRPLPLLRRPRPLALRRGSSSAGSRRRSAARDRDQDEGQGPTGSAAR